MADRKVRYALSEDKQKAVDQIKSRGNELQKQMVDKLFHIASTRPQLISGLPASRQDITEGDDIVILNEKDHTYYNLNDLSKPYVSTTTAISGNNSVTFLASVANSGTSITSNGFFS